MTVNTGKQLNFAVQRSAARRRRGRDGADAAGCAGSPSNDKQALYVDIFNATTMCDVFP
jgi:hypothetical protein